MVSHSVAFSYKYNTTERGGCSYSFFFLKVLELGKVPKRSSVFGLNSESFSVLAIVTLLE